MGRVYQIFDKLTILTIFIGFVLGFYLGLNHNSSDLWFVAVPVIIVVAFILTMPLIIDVFVSKDKHNNKLPINALVEAFLLNVGILTVCTAFGIVIASFLIGNYIAH
ncbi:hypothetical protein [uncultured Methanobrevibacter sp.]|jgi:hypothetical protein|uniref:hypothetical protein n=1 Tax=uncultured Methanobrevibacter sp. TaxID=253161 RepID=UPI0025CDBFFB|nr:hypothetical protein [uncultured Methanobrevibacter sp.]